VVAARPAQDAEFLATHGARLREKLGAEFTLNFERNTAHLKTAEIAAEITAAGSEFLVSVWTQGRPGRRRLAAFGGGLQPRYLESEGNIFAGRRGASETRHGAARLSG
jgi:hypothetical protein